MRDITWCWICNKQNSIVSISYLPSASHVDVHKMETIIPYDFFASYETRMKSNNGAQISYKDGKHQQNWGWGRLEFVQS